MKWQKLSSDSAAAVLDFDDRAHRMFSPYAEGAVADALHPISKLADQPQLRLLSGALMLAGLVAGNRRMMRAAARMIVAHEAATLAKDAVKREIERTRPRSAQSKSEKKPKKGKRRAKEVTSFPSGHSAGAFAVASAYSREYPEHGAAAIGAASVLALLQIARCAHYPTDIAAGAAIGLGTEKATDLLWSRRR